MVARRQRVESIAGLEFAITGRLASMKRDQAVGWIRSKGGEYSERPSTATSFLVVGQQGWPLSADGRLTHSLERAHALQRAGHSIEIISESEFLAALGLEERQEDLRRVFTLGELSRFLDVPLARIRQWMRTGLIRPAKVVRNLCSFDFQQVASAKALHQLLQSGATAARIRKSLALLRTWMPEAQLSLTQLELLERGDDVVVRRDDGQVVEPTGQLRFDFDDEPREASPPLRSPHRELFRHEVRDPQTWFEIGVRAEDACEFERAADAYQQALLAGGPQAAIAFNLGNVLHALARPSEAVQRFMQAVELAPDYVEAWNNLGIVLSEIDRSSEAVRAFERALTFAPTYADAHFNLAETLENLDRSEAAKPHWEAYLRQDPNSSEGRHAARRLAEQRTD